MRIVSGLFKGRQLLAPEGSITRPTSDRARESIFNVLAHADWSRPIEGTRVIDAFAGSGALGIEALSRGAEFCLFIETESRARGCIRDNIEKFNLFGNTRIHRRSAVDLGAKPASVGERFDIVFMDPPYGYNLVPSALKTLAAGGWVKPGALAVAETGPDDPEVQAPGWETLDRRTYGPADVTFLAYRPG